MREAARLANWDSLGDHHLDAVSPEQPGPKSRLSNRLAARFRTAILPTTPPAQPTARQTAVVRRDEQEEELDEEMLESRRSAKQASLDMMRAHLAEFKRANGQQATFKGWIAMLHPENVMLDHGLDLSDNRWLAMWNEAQTAHEPEPASSVDPSLDIDPSDDRRDMYV